MASAALAGCSSGWWRDAPPAPAVDAAPPPLATGAAPGPSDWQAEGPGGASYLPPPASGGAAYPPPSASAEPRRPLPPAAPSDYGPPPPVQGVRYDNVGYAAWSNEPGTIAAAHPSLPPGSFAEVTSLDTGKTVLVPITGVSRPGREIELSGMAAQELGLTLGGQGGVRVRATNATAADIGALRGGRMPPPRPDTPPVLLNALRKKLAGTLGQGPGAPPQPTPPPAERVPQPPRGAAPARTRAAGPGYYVQVAALSDAGRAASVARQIGGLVSSGGGLHRVRLGPFPDARRAQAARDGVAARGYGDARIVRED